MITFIQGKSFQSRKIKMVMKSHRLILTGFAPLFSGILLAGCASTDYGNTSSKNSITQF